MFYATPPIPWTRGGNPNIQWKNSNVLFFERSAYWKMASFSKEPLVHVAYLRKQALSKKKLSIFLQVSVNLTAFVADRGKIILDVAHNSNRVNLSFFFFFPSVAWETGNVMGWTWGLLWGRPLLARWKAHSSHFSYWIVLRLLFNVAFSRQPCTRQSVGMKLLSTILPNPDERY